MSGMSTWEDAVITIKHLTMLLEKALEENRVLNEALRTLEAKNEVSMQEWRDKVYSSDYQINPY